MAQRLEPLNAKRLGGESEDIKVKEVPSCQHYFIYKTAGEIVCRKCDAGMFIRGDEEVKNGRLYSGGKLVV